MEHCAIVILNYNGKEMLRQFLPIVIQHSSFSIFVADNASQDDSIDFLRTNHPEVQILALTQNHGFAGGYNRALEKIKGKFAYYILLNSDVEVTPHWDRTLIEWISDHPHVAAVQPKILSYTNPQYFDHAGAGGGFLDSLGYPFCRGRIFETLELDKGQYDDIIPVDWASGACMVVRAEDFYGTGGFDDRFFAHMEEIDLCWKWRLLGKDIYYHGGVEVKHVGGATLDKSSPQKTFLNFRNSLLMLHNNLPQEKFIFRYLCRVLLDLLAAFVFFLRGNPSHALSVFRAHQDFFRLKSKKKPLVLAPDLSNEDQEKKIKSILWTYYIKGRKIYADI
ncbi:hypothetical protein P872_16100 [Rhodonellum psychrophilum GCM71 = DSM 17998]|uniref:Glycosyltransferase 2-like domain-containing protein n=2 Tax=Rhodonellum TaxID=336827 RepID=U5BS18_9BACT|nr:MULTISPECIES: glycosyltransferase family 2 protein [Rhodonellum]ERM83365.1 hypothetical protein P872_16100 [Rhodonellum psychrophilum GCM71 = DSM 17998]SDZ38320.1 hypothetical protein SAMN05444412_11235 [Rhodonellum ikkaensis]